MSPLALEPSSLAVDLLTRHDGRNYELVGGALVERSVSFWSSFVAGRIYRLLANFCEERGLGWVLPEGTSYQCFPDESAKVRRADTSFFRGDRVSLRRATEEGHFTEVPDLVVEVVSPHDSYYEVEAKTRDWLAAGARAVWVINPESRLVRVHRANGSEATVPADQELSGEDVVPGFRCRVGDLFQPPTGVGA